MSRLHVNGVNLNVEVNGSGPPVLALHGFTGNLNTWNNFVNEAQTEYTVVQVDLLGHGSSDSPEDPRRYGVEHSVDDLLVILDRLGIPQSCWLGYSMGSRIALVGATRFPERCVGLVLEGASPGLFNPEERAQRVQRDESLAQFITKDGLERFVDYWENLPLFESQAQLPVNVRTCLRKQRLRNNIIGLSNSLRGGGIGNQRPVHTLLSGLAIPVLCVIGEKDGKFMKIANSMCRQLAHGHIASISNSGHAPHMESPGIFNDVVLKFLRNLPSWDNFISG